MGLVSWIQDTTRGADGSEVKTGTYTCNTCGVTGIQPGGTCRCAGASASTLVTAPKAKAAAAASRAMPTLEERERDLQTARVAQRQNRIAIQKAATPFSGPREGFWARRLELDRCRLVKEQLESERKSVVALYEMTERREEREGQEQDRGLARELLAREGGVN